MRRIAFIIFLIAIFVFSGCSIQKNIEKNKANIEQTNNDNRTKFITIKHEHMIWDENKDVKVVKMKNEDINNDGIVDSIEYTVVGQAGNRCQDVSLKINNCEISLITNNPSIDFNIVDIDTRDDFKEIDIFEDGPSDDPKSMFFIYDGIRIIKIGELNADEYEFDGMSKVFTKLDKINLFEPSIDVGWTELDEKGRLTYKCISKDIVIGKQYKIVFDMDSENTPWRIFKTADSNPYGEDYIAEIGKDDMFLLTDVVRQGGKDIAFKVKLNNGKEGWLIHIFGGD